MVVIDLFCGVGGLTYGLRKAGLNVVAGLDNDESCKFAYEKNNKAIFIHADITSVPVNILNDIFGKDNIKILVGCAPCQTFSKHTQKNKERVNDKKWGLLYSFLDKIKGTNPDIISMENVPELIKYDVFQDFIKEIGESYHFSYKVVQCANYGVPQQRRRLVLLASKFGEINIIPETHTGNNQVALQHVIASLPHLSAGSSNISDKLHISSALTPLNLQRIRQSKQGGTWKDWDSELLANCHKKETGHSYSSVYGRMQWDKPAPTITTQFFSYGTGRFGHPEQDRALSLREGALLQSFPMNYQFVDPAEKLSIKTTARHIGNAVPPQLGFVIGKSILKHMETHDVI